MNIKNGTLNGGKGERDLAATVNVRVADTQNVLKLSGGEVNRHFDGKISTI